MGREVKSEQRSSALDDEQIDRVSVGLERRPFRAGELVSLFPDPGGRVYLVLRGELRLFYRGADRRELGVRTVSRGALLGASALFAVEPPPLQARAKSEGVLCSAAPGHFLRLFGQSPDLLQSLLRELAGQVVETEERLHDLTVGGSRARLAGVLRRLADEDGETVEGGGRRVRRHVTHLELARQIGASRETVTRGLAALEDAGAIRREGWRLIVQDLSTLDDTDFPIED